MKLNELKAKTRKAWAFNCEMSDVVTQWENYSSDIKRFGDRRRKATWVRALCHFTVRSARLGYLYAPEITLISFFSDSPNIRHFWYPEYRKELLAALMEMPSGPKYVLLGLRALSKDLESREEHCGVFELVEAAARAKELQNQTSNRRKPTALLPVHS